MRSALSRIRVPHSRFSKCDLRSTRTAASLTAIAALVMAFQAGCSEDTTQPPVEPEPCAAKACSDAPGTICTWAGTGNQAFNGDGKPLLETSFYWPIDLTYHNGTFYLVDWNNEVIRIVTPEGTVQTKLGSGYPGDGPIDWFDTPLELSPPGYPAREVNLNHPTHILGLPDGTVLLTAWHNHKLRHYDPATGLMYVRCGSSYGYSGDGGPAHDAQVNQPIQSTLGPDGALYVLDMRNERVRRIGVDGVITSVVGTGEPGYSGDGGPPSQAQIRLPNSTNPWPGGSLLFDPQGRLYISDSMNHVIRRVDFDLDVIETFAGTGVPGFAGDGGPAALAQMRYPRDLLLHDGKLYVAEEENHRIRVIDMATGTISTFAGNGTAGFCGDGGPATEASLNRPAGLEYADGYIYIADTLNSRYRRVKL